MIFKKKLFILVMLAIGLAQSAGAMKEEPEEYYWPLSNTPQEAQLHKLICESSKSPDNQAVIQDLLNQLILAAAKSRNSHMVYHMAQVGVKDVENNIIKAQVDAQDENGRTALTLLAAHNHMNGCRALLDLGAQMDQKDTTGLTAMQYAAMIEYTKYESLRELITYSRFNPFRTDAEIKKSQHRIFTALCALKRAYPPLYAQKDVRKKILWDYLPEDVCNCAFEIHKNHPERIPSLPLQVVRLLVQHGKLDKEKTVAAIKAHDYECLSPIMLQALISTPIDSMRPLLNPAALEKNFGVIIDHNIRRKLSLPTPITIKSIMDFMHQNFDA